MQPYTGSCSLTSASNTSEFTVSSRCSSATSFRILLTLLAPNTLWTFANFFGSSDLKYGANWQFGVHLLFKNLQAAQEELDRGSWLFILIQLNSLLENNKKHYVATFDAWFIALTTILGKLKTCYNVYFMRESFISYYLL